MFCFFPTQNRFIFSWFVPTNLDNLGSPIFRNSSGNQKPPEILLNSLPFRGLPKHHRSCRSSMDPNRIACKPPKRWLFDAKLGVKQCHKRTIPQKNHHKIRGGINLPFPVSGKFMALFYPHYSQYPSASKHANGNRL